MAFHFRLPGRAQPFWATAVVLIFIACAGFALFARRPGEPPGGSRLPAKPDQAVPTFDRIYLKNVAYSSYVRGEKTFTLQAEEIVHRKRKLGPLTLNPIKEVEMNGVRIEIYQGAPPPGGQGPRAEDVDLPLQTILKESLSAKDLGFVTRILMNRFHLALLRGGVEQLSMVAGAATVGLDSAVLRIDDGFTLTTRAGEELAARSAEWRFAGRRLFIPGAYVLKVAQNTRRGEGGTFRINSEGRVTREELSTADPTAAGSAGDKLRGQ